MKEEIIEIATCGCKYCKWGQTKNDRKFRNRKRRIHIKNEILHFKQNGDLDSFRQEKHSPLTD